MEETFKESVIEKITQIDKEVKSLSGKSATMEEIKGKENILTAGIDELKSVIAQLNKNAVGVAAAFSQIKEISGKIERYTHILENPKEKNVHHIHHFRWPLWVAVGALLLLSLSLCGLYVSHQKLNRYIANDTKYRSLKLIQNKDLEALLYSEDSAYRADPDMRKGVQQAEAERKHKLELLMQAQEKQQEAEDLKSRAEKMNK